jgi:uncharacterized damage-inducible protein DinB
MNVLTQLYDRELTAVIKELNAFHSEENIWKTVPGISNSAGNLCLHLIGNLNHFIGATLVNTGYVRNRELEFSSKNISRATLIKDLQSTIDLLNTSLPSINEEELNADFPLQLNNTTYSTNQMLHHLLSHLSYHLGQVNYLRRFLEPIQ